MGVAILWLMRVSGLSRIGLIVAFCVIAVPIAYGGFRIWLHFEKKEAVELDRMEAERKTLRQRLDDLRRKGEITRDQTGLTDDQSAYCLAGYQDCCDPRSKRLRECPAPAGPAAR